MKCHLLAGQFKSFSAIRRSCSLTWSNSWPITKCDEAKTGPSSDSATGARVERRRLAEWAARWRQSAALDWHQGDLPPQPSQQRRNQQDVDDDSSEPEPWILALLHTILHRWVDSDAILWAISSISMCSALLFPAVGLKATLAESFVLTALRPPPQTLLGFSEGRLGALIL